jgi:hypothetical protein
MGLVESSVKIRMMRLGISAEQLAQFAVIRPQILHPGLTGRRPLSNPDIEKVHCALDKLERLVVLLQPVPIDMTSTKHVLFLLRRLEDGDIEKLMTPFAKIVAEEMQAAGIE